MKPYKKFFISVLRKQKDDHMYFGNGSLYGYYIFELSNEMEGTPQLRLIDNDNPLEIKENHYYEFWFDYKPKNEKYSIRYESQRDHPFYISNDPIGGSSKTEPVKGYIPEISGNTGYDGIDDSNLFFRFILNTSILNEIEEKYGNLNLWFQCGNHDNMGGPIKVIRSSSSYPSEFW